LRFLRSLLPIRLPRRKRAPHLHHPWIGTLQLLQRRAADPCGHARVESDRQPHRGHGENFDGGQYERRKASGVIRDMTSMNWRRVYEVNRVQDRRQERRPHWPPPPPSNGAVVVQCSTCAAAFSSFGRRWFDAWREAKRRGWLARKDSDGKWSRHCPSCLNRSDWQRGA
jgi:hypothetical protein